MYAYKNSSGKYFHHTIWYSSMIKDKYGDHPSPELLEVRLCRRIVFLMKTMTLSHVLCIYYICEKDLGIGGSFLTEIRYIAVCSLLYSIGLLHVMASIFYMMSNVGCSMELGVSVAELNAPERSL